MAHLQFEGQWGSTDLTLEPHYSALGIPPRDKTELYEFTSILDPDEEGFATYGGFVAICALKIRARDDAETEAAHADEVDEAYALFAGGHPDDVPAITIAHLRRVAAVLKEDVDDDVLRDMILEANEGAGVGHGVGKEDFDRVMARAGVWRG
jgi:hypothetical protein